MASAPLSVSVSLTARRVTNIVEDIHTALEDNASIGLRRQALFKRLTGLQESHANPNWDGYGALPINQASYQYAEKFLRRYPINLPVPELSVDPDGEVSFEWSESSENVFTVSINPQGRLSYAGLFGEAVVRNSAPFTGDIPPEIIDHIQRVGLED